MNHAHEERKKLTEVERKPYLAVFKQAGWFGLCEGNDAWSGAEQFMLYRFQNPFWHTVMNMSAGS